MSPAEDPALQPIIVLRVVIRSPDLETFVSKYSRFVKDDRIFIFTKSSQPAGTRVRFTLELSDGQPLINGEGTVTRIRPDTGDPAKPPGMELKFAPLDLPSRELVARMLQVREGQFREESTDVQTNVRDGNAVPATRDFDEAPPSLPPLAKTGKLPSINDEPAPRQDESGNVTIAQAPPGTRAAQEVEPDTQPSGAFRPLGDRPALPIATGDKQSGGFATPTPLPAPIPASADFAAAQRELTGSAHPRLEKPGNGAIGLDSSDGVFAAVGPAPAFAEAFRAPLLGRSGATADASGAVPANPFSEVSDTAIEYFVEWSVEQSTAPKPKVAEASYANVPMATPRAEKRRRGRGRLLAGMAIGVFLGLPLGGAIVWFMRPLPAPIIVERMPEPTPAAALGDLALATTRAAVPDKLAEPGKAALAERPAAVPRAARAEKPPRGEQAELEVASKPPGAQVNVDGEARGKTPVTLSLAPGTHEVAVAKERYATLTQSVEVPGKVELVLKRPAATLHIESEPPGGEVIVEGKPRGKTPVDVTLDAFHHYDVQVMLLGTKPWHKRVSLKPPQTDVTAKLSVVRNP